MSLFYVLARFLFNHVFENCNQLELRSCTDASEIHDEIEELSKELGLFKDVQKSMLESEYRLILDNATDLSSIGWQTLSYILLYRIAEVHTFYKMLEAFKEKFMFSSSFEEFFKACDIEYTFYLRMLVASYLCKEHFMEFVISLFTLLGMDKVEIFGLREALIEFYCTLCVYIQAEKLPLLSTGRFRMCIQRLKKYRTMCLTRCKLPFCREFFDSTKYNEIIQKLLTKCSLD